MQTIGVRSQNTGNSIIHPTLFRYVHYISTSLYWLLLALTPLVQHGHLPQKSSGILKQATVLSVKAHGHFFKYLPGMLLDSKQV